MVGSQQREESTRQYGEVVKRRVKWELIGKDAHAQDFFLNRKGNQLKGIKKER